MDIRDAKRIILRIKLNMVTVRELSLLKLECERDEVFEAELAKACSVNLQLLRLYLDTGIRRMQIEEKT